MPFVAEPFAFAAGVVDEGRAKLASGCECNDEAVDADGTGEGTGFEVAVCV